MKGGWGLVVETPGRGLNSGSRRRDRQPPWRFRLAAISSSYIEAEPYPGMTSIWGQRIRAFLASDSEDAVDPVLSDRRSQTRLCLRKNVAAKLRSVVRVRRGLMLAGP